MLTDLVGQRFGRLVVTKHLDGGLSRYRVAKAFGVSHHSVALAVGAVLFGEIVRLRQLGGQP